MRVDRTFAFVDLCGFTAFTEAHGDDEAVAVLTGFRGAVRSIAADFGVRVAKWLGDGVMIVSGDGVAVVASVLELQQRVVQRTARAAAAGRPRARSRDPLRGRRLQRPGREPGGATRRRGRSAGGPRHGAGRPARPDRGCGHPGG